MQVEVNKVIIIILIFFTIIFKVKAGLENTIEYECLTETGVSGLFQNQRKFLKETEFFPDKTIMGFSNDFQNLTEKDISIKKETETKYKFNCKKENTKKILRCDPVGKVISYKIKFSLDTLRYRKSLITDYWIEGRGNEIDYVHISHGYCYRIND